MNKLVVRSKTSKNNVIAMTIAVAAFALLVMLSLYKWFIQAVFQPLELMAEAMVLVVLIERMSVQYTYEMDEKVLRLTKYGLLAKIIHEVPYNDIIGVYRYKPQLLGIIKFRRTYRFNSALDGQDVWTMAYTASGFQGKMENRRFYFKPGEKLLVALQEKLPDKVMIPEEQVIKAVLGKDKDE